MNRQAENIMSILRSFGWGCDLYRAPTTDPRNPPNRIPTAAVMNAIVAWRAERWMHVCWLWEVGQMGERELLARIAEKEAA